MIELPPPKLDSDFSLERALRQRRSVRNFGPEPLTLEQLSQLLWACQGITSPLGFRTAPSAGALYPLEVYAVVKGVSGLEAGVYHYLPRYRSCVIEQLQKGELSQRLADAALGQECITGASVNIIIAAAVERTRVKYGARAERYVFIEVGHAAQNVCLQAQALGLGAVTVGALYEHNIRKLLAIEADPVYIICIGKERE